MCDVDKSRLAACEGLVADWGDFWGIRGLGGVRVE